MSRSLHVNLIIGVEIPDAHLFNYKQVNGCPSFHRAPKRGQYCPECGEYVQTRTRAVMTDLAKRILRDEDDAAGDADERPMVHNLEPDPWNEDPVPRRRAFGISLVNDSDESVTVSAARFSDMAATVRDAMAALGIAGEVGLIYTGWIE